MKFIKNFENVSNSSETIIVVDIQPSYKKYINFDINSFCDFLNNHNGQILYLYNGPDLGYEDENEIFDWLLDNGLNEDKYYNITFFEKNYGFFRDIMDKYISDDNIVEIIKYLINNNIQDSRNFSEKDKEYLISNGISEDYLNDDYSIYLPELYNFFKSYLNKNNNILVGGGYKECLKEVELLLNSMDINYIKQFEYVY